MPQRMERRAVVFGQCRLKNRASIETAEDKGGPNSRGATPLLFENVGPEPTKQKGVKPLLT